MWRLESIIQKNTVEYVVDATTAYRMGLCLFRQPGVRVLALRIYNSENELTFHHYERANKAMEEYEPDT